jgi:hypothetical protein
MKRRLGLLALALLVSASLAIVKPVADQPLVDKEKSRQELETMKGILRTSLSYAMRSLSGTERADDREFRLLGMEATRVDAFYLHGQGAVFVIPVGNMGRGFHLDLPALAFAAIPDPEELARITEDALRLAGANHEGAVADLEQDREKQEEQREKAERQRERLREQLEAQRQRLEERRIDAGKRREELNKRREELSKKLDQLATHLRDTLATYGDSLTIVRPDESVTVILTTESGFGHWGPSESADTRVLSVKRALVTDLKAGKVTRDEFNRRLIEYSY